MALPDLVLVDDAGAERRHDAEPASQGSASLGRSAVNTSEAIVLPFADRWTILVSYSIGFN